MPPRLLMEEEGAPLDLIRWTLRKLLSVGISQETV